MDVPARRLLRREDAVVVVVDVQEKLLPAIAGAAGVLRACRRIIRVADLLGVPVVFTEQYPRGLGPTVTDLAELFNGRKPIQKTTFGCYACSEFAEAMLRLGCSQVVLCGIEAHICVFQTGIQALERNAAVYVLDDAVGARTVGAREVGLARMRAAGVVPSHTEMAIYELLGEAATPDFRSILPIIKEEADRDGA